MGNKGACLRLQVDPKITAAGEAARFALPSAAEWMLDNAEEITSTVQG